MTKKEMLEKLNGSVNDFFSLLCDMRGASLLNQKLVQLLVDFRQDKKKYSANAQKVLHIFFSLANDGNTCVSLDPTTLLAKWKTKWDGLVLLAMQEQGTEESANAFLAASDFKSVIEAGCKALVKEVAPPLVIENLSKNGKEEPFLFTEKYLDAKNVIENCFDKAKEECVFKGGSEISESIDKCNANIASIIKPSAGFKLRKAQTEAILKGEQQNLIITGGPGTGKTTVMFFLLWNLLKKHPEMCSWDIHFAAPSGKAADRLRESIGENFEMLTDAAQKTFEVARLKNVDNYSTMHRLLSYNPQTNSFRYNAKAPFAEKSIFVIDEASMIDLSLFASFMQALPKKDFRLYILGDRDQLPSVEAGAVLGEILGLDKDSVVELTESNRFDNNSNIGRLSRFIQKKLGEDELQFKLKWSPWDSGIQLSDPTKPDKINLLRLGDGEAPLTRAEEEAKLQELLGAWVKRFYKGTGSDLLAMAKEISPDQTPENIAKCEALWKLADSARILSAERRGLQGVENLNKMIVRSLGKKDTEPFDGQLMMLTKNQPYFDLYNGDSGVVVNCDIRPMLMIKRKGNFVFYPISLLPAESIETAFAITIHKSQGSGYPNIMMFLPTRKGHPLLNRQILYTGVTRTKKQSLTIVATPETFKAACETVSERDTGIEI